MNKESQRRNDFKNTDLKVMFFINHLSIYLVPSLISLLILSYPQVCMAPSSSAILNFI